MNDSEELLKLRHRNPPKRLTGRTQNGVQENKRIYSKRLAIAEPPFGHMHEMGLTQFMLRGRPKVNAQ